jgi:hypothetical protein
MRQIAQAYVHCAYNAESGLQGIAGEESTTAHDWIRVLAEQNYCNDPRVLMFDFDYLVKAGGGPPRRVWDAASQSLDGDFAQKALSIAVVAGCFSTDSAIPICWTRGLQENGHWAEAEGDRGGVFGSSGGIIAFTDGSAQWFDDLHGEKNPLVQWGTDERTSNIYECLPPGTRVLDWKGILYSAPAPSGGGAQGSESGSQGGSGEDEVVFLASAEKIEPPPEPPMSVASLEEDDGEEDIPAYGSWSLDMDFADTSSLEQRAEACGVDGVVGSLSDTYASLQSGAENKSIDSSLSQAFQSLATALMGLGLNLDTSKEAQTLFWSGFLGDYATYTDNTDVIGCDPARDAAEALVVLNGLDTAIGSAYDNLSGAQKSQFTAVLEAFSSGIESSEIDFDSNGAKLAQAYLSNQAWIAAMNRTLAEG